MTCATSSPSLSDAPFTTFERLGPSKRCQLFCAGSTSLNTMARAVLFDRQPATDGTVAHRGASRHAWYENQRPRLNGLRQQ
jgi:hypothetical protein